MFFIIMAILSGRNKPTAAVVIPSNYITEDSLNNYVAENGTTFYIQES